MSWCFRCDEERGCKNSEYALLVHLKWIEDERIALDDYEKQEAIESSIDCHGPGSP